MQNNYKKFIALFSNDEVSLRDLKNFFRDLFSSTSNLRSVVFIYVGSITFISFLVGIFVALTEPKEYEARCIILSDQDNSGINNSMQGISNLIGISGGAVSANTGVGTDLYSSILKNNQFLLELSKVPFYNLDGLKNISLNDFFKNYGNDNFLFARFKNLKKNHGSTLFENNYSSRSKINFSNNLKSNFNLDRLLLDSTRVLSLSNTVNVFKLTSEENEIIHTLKDRINITQNGKQITISVKMPEAWLSALATKEVYELLISYLIRNRLEKQLETLSFLEARTKEAEQKYRANQLNLANFKDNNYGVVFQSIQTRESQLQNEVNLSFNIYNQLANQLEQARIQLKKDTPVFAILEPIYVPENPLEKNKFITVLFFTFFGLIISFLLFIILLFKAPIKENFNEK
jgi:hypothetical protein